MLGSTLSSTKSAGGIWGMLGKKDTGSKSKYSGTDPNVANLTSIKAAGMRGNGPAVQRIVVVGQCMSGKRSLIDRLRKAAEPPALDTNKHFHGKFGQARAKAANAEEKRAEAVTGPLAKTITASIRGCGAHYTSLAYHYNDAEIATLVDQSSSFDFNDERVRKIAALIADPSPLVPSPSGKNTVTEIIACDVVESLESALPTYECLQYTAIIIVLDAMDIANGGALIAHWANAVNSRVRLLAYQQQNNKILDKSLTSAGGGKQGVSKSQSNPAVITDLSGADVRVFTEKRTEESLAATLAANGDVRTRFTEAYRSSVGSSPSGSGDMPSIPEAFRLLLPSLIMLSKVDLLEEACKANANSAAGGSYSVAIQHARWLALQRGSAFAAASTKNFDNETTNYFQGLWTYIAYGLLPGQYELTEYLKAQRANASKGEALTVEEQEEESRREVAALDARRKRKLERKGQRGEGEGDEDAEAGDDAEMAETDNGDDAEDRDYRRRLQLEVLAVSILADNTVRAYLNATPNQLIFIPRGLEDASLIEKQTTSATFVQIRFSSFATSTGSEALKQPKAVSSPTMKEQGGGSSSVNVEALPTSALEVTRNMYDTFVRSMQTELSSNTAPRHDPTRATNLEAARADSSSPAAHIPEADTPEDGKDAELMIWDE